MRSLSCKRQCDVIEVSLSSCGGNYFCPMDSETNNFYAQCTNCDKCSFLFSPEEAKYRWLNNDALSIFS